MNTPFLYKKCTACGEWKIANTSNFHKHKKCKFGLSNKCKICNKEYAKEYYKKNKDEMKEYRKQYYKENKEKVKEYGKKYREENKEKEQERHRKYRENNKEKINEQRRKCYENNKEKINEHRRQCYKEKDRERNRKYRENNKEKIKEITKQYYEKNKDKIKEYGKKYREENKEYIKKRAKKYCASERGRLILFNNRTKRRTLMDKQGKGITKEQWLEMMKFFDWKCAYSGETLGTKTRTIDHIAPLAQGGAHEIWNLTPMLFSYNASKHSVINVLNWYKEQEYFSEERLAKIVEWQQYAYDKWATEDDDPLILITDLYTGDNDIWL